MCAGPASGPGQPAGTITFTYDGFGRVLTVTDPISRTVTYGYDAAGRHNLTTYPDTSTEVTNYDTGDNSARVLSTLDRNGNTTKYAYDTTGRVNQVQVVDATTSLVLTTTTKTYDRRPVYCEHQHRRRRHRIHLRLFEPNIDDNRPSQRNRRALDQQRLQPLLAS